MRNLAVLELGFRPQPIAALVAGAPARLNATAIPAAHI